MSDMPPAHPDLDFVGSSAASLRGRLRLRGDALQRRTGTHRRSLLATARSALRAGRRRWRPAPRRWKKCLIATRCMSLVQDIDFESLGRYEVSGRATRASDDQRQLASLARSPPAAASAFAGPAHHPRLRPGRSAAGAPVADPRPDPRIGADHRPHGLHHQLEQGRRAAVRLQRGGSGGAQHPVPVRRRRHETSRRLRWSRAGA
jgi:hypothetical protein